MSLGEGLQSLIPPKKSGAPTNVPISKADKKNQTEQVVYLGGEKIKKNPYQPRKNFDRAKLQELAGSIKQHGILQPLVVSKKGEEYYLVAGQRRLEAAKMAGLSEVPVIIRSTSKQTDLELALVENLQRDNLNPIEKAYAFKKLIDEFNFVQEDVAKKIGKSREVVANALRLLNLPAEIQRAILENKISEGHGRAILALSDNEKQLLLLKEILKNNLSVRQTEALVKKFVPKRTKLKNKKDPYLKDLEDKLSNVLGTRITLTRKGKKGKIVIEFFSREEMENIIDKILRK